MNETLSSIFNSIAGGLRQWNRIRTLTVVVLFLAGLTLSACLSLLSPTGPVRTPVSLPVADGGQPQIAISPPSGYAGVYVQVVGNGWPANDLVLVTLSDDAGRSGILAASAADSSGQVTTGFLYPISPRWLSEGSHTIVAYTADGNLQASAEFQVTPGEGVTPVAARPSASPTATAAATTPGQTPTATGTPGAPRATATPSATTQASPTPLVITDWRGDYWANSTLSGDQALVRNDPAVFFDWGSGSPAPNLPGDQFSARWTRQLDFDAGVYRFFLEVDDGARLFVDDQLVLDEWRAGSQRVASATVNLSAGRHTLRVEYFERTGMALARFWWERQLSFTGWEGRYYTNPNLQGEPAVVRDDAAINFDWGNGSPAAAIGNDNFSVRWKRTVNLAPGRYRFYARMDDGLRVRVDGQTLLDEWRDSSDRTVATEVELPGGSYQLDVEYYERSGSALVSFWWEVAPEPTATHTPSWTPTPLPSATPTATVPPTITPSHTPEPTATDTAVATATATPTATPTATAGSDSSPAPTETATVEASGDSSTPLPDAPEIGEAVTFERLVMPLLLTPRTSIFAVVTEEESWAMLLERLRPPKTARPAQRPTPGSGDTPPTATRTPTATVTATVTPSPEQDSDRVPVGSPVSPGQSAPPRLPDFDEEIVLAAILGVDFARGWVRIVDVRLEADDLYVKVLTGADMNQSDTANSGADAVIVPWNALPDLSRLQVHFVDENYELIESSVMSRQDRNR